MKTNEDKIVIATIKSWNIDNAKEFMSISPQLKISLITDKDDLNYETIKELKPKYIFFPHWSWIIPPEIYDNFECVVFHMTDLPFGRGGSPLQNLIERGIEKTKISAIRVVNGLDAGPVYFKHDLDLGGTATDIFVRGSEIVFNTMIPQILNNSPEPTPQQGEPVLFKRRTPEQGDISHLESTNKVYDFIRMLDGEGYPHAFIETDSLKIEFTGARKNDSFILAEVKIRIKDAE